MSAGIGLRDFRQSNLSVERGDVEIPRAHLDQHRFGRDPGADVDRDELPLRLIPPGLLLRFRESRPNRHVRSSLFRV